MGITKGKGFAIACVAALALVLGFVFFGNPFTDEPKAEASTNEVTKSVYPERAVIDTITYNKKGVAIGCGEGTLSVPLTAGDGTVTVTGLPVKSDWANQDVTVMFDGKALAFMSGYIDGSSTNEAFSMPELGPNEVLSGIVLDTRDFSESAQFQGIILCGGGM